MFTKSTSKTYAERGQNTLPEEFSVNELFLSNKQQLLESLPKISIQLLGLMDLFWRDLLQYTTNYFGSNIVVKDKDW